MKIIESKQFKELSTQLGKESKELSNQLISELIRLKIIEDSPSIYRENILNSINRDIMFSEFTDAMRNVGIPICSNNYDLVMELIVIGDCDCPECGFEMEETDAEYKQIGGFGYFDEPDYVPVWVEKTCNNCGYKERNEY